MRKCIELNLGIAFFPAKSWKGEFSNNVLIKDICGFKRKTYAYYNKKQYLSKCVKNFLKMLTEEFSKQ